MEAMRPVVGGQKQDSFLSSRRAERKKKQRNELTRTWKGYFISRTLCHILNSILTEETPFILMGILHLSKEIRIKEIWGL